VKGSCEHGNEPSGSIKGGEFLDRLSDHKIRKKDCAPRNSFNKLKKILILSLYPGRR
jgi:hypothetical protein